MASSFLWFRDHTQRRTTVGRTPLDEWSARRRDLYLTTNNTHNRQTSMAPGWIRTHDLGRRAAADLRLRPRGLWDRQHSTITSFIHNLFTDIPPSTTVQLGNSWGFTSFTLHRVRTNVPCPMSHYRSKPFHWGRVCCEQDVRTALMRVHSVTAIKVGDRHANILFGLFIRLFST
jgi:hypothetical protein